MNKEWRPDDWMNEFKKDSDYYQCREAGASAGIEALIKWLFEPCTEHPIPASVESVRLARLAGYNWEVGYPKHRYLCPQCVKKMEAKDV